MPEISFRHIFFFVITLVTGTGAWVYPESVPATTLVLVILVNITNHGAKIGNIFEICKFYLEKMGGNNKFALRVTD
jgi:hypothetical protein